MVRGCGEFWTVEREIDEALTFPHGPVPMLLEHVKQRCD